MIRSHCWSGAPPASLARLSLLSNCSPLSMVRAATQATHGWADDPRARCGLYEVADSRATDVSHHRRLPVTTASL